jgi:hypothetical protein
MFRHTRKKPTDVERVGEIPRYVVADEAKVRQVLSNLLGNAVKFTQTGGIALRVRTSPGEAAGLRLVAEVEDTGQGISEKDITGLFQRFEQKALRRSERERAWLAISRGCALMEGTSRSAARGKGASSMSNRLELRGRYRRSEEGRGLRCVVGSSAAEVGADCRRQPENRELLAQPLARRARTPPGE